MAKHMVKCSVCNEYFDASIIPYVKTSARRYAHKTCYEEKMSQMSQEEKDKIELEEYIKKLLNINSITPRIKKQIKQYIEEYDYSYSGIKKALVYFYEVRGNSTEKANEGIGIVSYVYKKAFDYYYALWLAQNKNTQEQIEQYKPETIEITITPPIRKIKKKKRFTFLDEQEGLNE